MKSPVVIIGVGEMGGVFARGFLKNAHPVYPVTREVDAARLASELPDPALALVAVAEADFAPIMDRLPHAWLGRLGLLQNELLPRDWEDRDLKPTVISVWFEKKKGQEVKVLLPSPIYGPQAQLIADALAAIDIPTRVLTTPNELIFELVRKNLYILTTNIAGLRAGGTVGELREHHQVFMHEVALDVLAIQDRLTCEKLPWERLIEAMLEAFDGDPAHKCMGRSAPARLARAIEQADGAGLGVPTLRQVARESQR